MVLEVVGALPVGLELLQPVEGPSLWREYLDSRGEGIASIAVMFKTVEESEAAKREFERRGMRVTMKANIGDHIEYYYLDTKEKFGCMIESGSGHAPSPDAAARPGALTWTIRCPTTRAGQHANVISRRYVAAITKPSKVTAGA